MEAISGRKTLQEIAADHAIHPIQVSQWKKQLLESASDLFGKGRKDKERGDQQTREAELFQEIGKLKMELEWLKKKSQLLDRP
jgi:transposase-like protein